MASLSGTQLILDLSDNADAILFAMKLFDSLSEKDGALASEARTVAMKHTGVLALSTKEIESSVGLSRTHSSFEVFWSDTKNYLQGIGQDPTLIGLLDESVRRDIWLLGISSGEAARWVLGENIVRQHVKEST